MLLSIDLNSEIPIYMQIRNQVIEGIARGNLSQGDTLPSVRQMASDLGINLHTVNKVYTLLKQEGFLTVHRKSGVVISNSKSFKASEDFGEKLAGILQPVIAESICRDFSKEEFLDLCMNIYNIFQNSKGGGK